uniref:Small acidic protein-like domain-containing protein n=1 Tax=Strigamia maritima TaxID=126957 RepID=T1JJR2_STRMM
MTPQLAVQQAMAAVNAKAQQLTGISLPKYYNPAAVNPMKYAEQMQKRKLLWNCNKDKQVQPVVVQTTSNNKWEKTTFAQDLDGKMTAKFRKLMGIKSDEAGEEIVHDEKNVSEEQIRKQEEMFRKLDQQYEVARMSTHTHRGVGLGFSSQSHHLFPK